MDEQGVSPVIGTVLVLGILTVVTGTMLTVVMPQIQDSQDRGEFQVVAGQMAKVSGDVTQMALGGNVGEVRQRTVAMANGALHVDHGHLWALSIGLVSEKYHQAPPGAVAPGDHPEFEVVDHDGPEGSRFVVEYDDQAPPDVYCVLHRFTGSDWQATDLDDSGSDYCNEDTGVPGSDPFQVVLPSDRSLREGPWRLQVRHDSSEGDLVGLIFVYELNRIRYEVEGALSSRALYMENGALFTKEDTTVFSSGHGLYRTAATGGGSGGINMRAAQMSSPEMPGTSGSVKATFQFSLGVQEYLAHDLGAIHARLQPIDGPMTKYWATHLAGGDFDPDTHAESVVFVWSNPSGDYAPYPLSVIYSDIRLGMVTN